MKTKTIVRLIGVLIALTPLTIVAYQMGDPRVMLFPLFMIAAIAGCVLLLALVFLSQGMMMAPESTLRLLKELKDAVADKFKRNNWPI